MRKPKAEDRKAPLRAVHASRRQLGLDDDTYRALLERVTGKRSAADLDAAQLRKVLNEMRRLGAAQPTQPREAGRSKPAHYPGTPHNIDSLPAQIEVVEALLTEMRLSWGYAEAIARRMFRVEKVAWLKDQKQVVAVLTALYQERKKRQLLADIELVMASGVVRADILDKVLGELAPDLLDGRRKGWRRHLPTLTAVQARMGELGLIAQAEAWHVAKTASASALKEPAHV